MPSAVGELGQVSTCDYMRSVCDKTVHVEGNRFVISANLSMKFSLTTSDQSPARTS